MTPETEITLKRNLLEIENDIAFLERKKRISPSYQIDREIFLHRKIMKSIQFEIEQSVQS